MSPFISRPAGEELRLCQRYAQIVNWGIAGEAENTTTVAVSTNFAVPMRATPAISRVAAVTLRYQGGDISSTGSLANVTAQPYGVWLQIDGFSGLTSGKVVVDRGTSASLLAVAELN